MTNEKSVHLHRNFSSIETNNTITLQDWIALVKSSEHSQRIDEIRLMNLTKEQLKAYKLLFPCITPNFLFHTAKFNNNITGPTGYMFIDIDVPNFDINTIKDKLTAYYKSFSGKHYSVFVRVDGLSSDAEEFKACYDEVCNQLGLSGIFDEFARKRTQYSLLSHDANAYYNGNGYVFDMTSIKRTLPLANTTSTNTIDKKRTQPLTNTYITPTYSERLGTKLRFDDLDEFDMKGKTIISNWNEGFTYTKAFLPFVKLDDNRYNTLLAYGNNILAMNTHLTPDGLYTLLDAAQKVMCTKPMEPKRVQLVVTTLFKYLNDGSLRKKQFKKPRRILLTRHVKLTRQEKQDLIGQEISKHFKNVGIERIQSIIDGWNFQNHGKISVRNIAKHFDINKKTVSKYYNHFFDKIKTMNQIQSPQVLDKAFTGIYNFNMKVAFVQASYYPSKSINSVLIRDHLTVVMSPATYAQGSTTQAKIIEIKKALKKEIENAAINYYSWEIVRDTIVDAVVNIEKLDTSVNMEELFTNIEAYYLKYKKREQLQTTRFITG